jgi:hypothetical protein
LFCLHMLILISILLLIKVSRMLVGGIKVVGVYVWVNDNAFKNSTIMLCQVYICYRISVTSVYMLCYVLAMKH